MTGGSRRPGGLLASCSGGSGSAALAFSTLKAKPLPSPGLMPPTSYITERGGDSGKKRERAGQLGLYLGTHLWAVGCWGPRGPQQWTWRGQEWWGPPLWPQGPQGLGGRGLSGTCCCLVRDEKSKRGWGVGGGPKHRGATYDPAEWTGVPTRSSLLWPPLCPLVSQQGATWGRVWA